MDLDQYVTRHQNDWYRLRQLTEQAGRSTRHLSPSELDELLRLYQRTSAQLSYVRTHFKDRRLISDLAITVAGARAVVYRRRGRATTAVGSFFTVTFPAAVWACRWFVLGAALALFLPAFGVGFWLSNDDRALNLSMNEETRALLASGFSERFTSLPAQDFSAYVMVNNVIVGFGAFALSTIGALPGVLYLANWAVSLGQTGAVMHAAGEGQTFWGLVIPHGLLELSAICVATGAGMHVGWAMLVPGDRTRGEAIAENGSRAIVVAIGAALAFVIAALVEGFVSPSNLPTSLRIGLGLVIAAGFWTYVVVYGSRAAAMGLTGRLGEAPLSWQDEKTDLAHLATR